MHIHLLCIEALFCATYLFPQTILQFFIFFTTQICFLLVNSKGAVVLISITCLLLHLAAILQFQLQTIFDFIFTNSISSFKTVDHNFFAHMFFSFSCSVATVMLIPSLIKITVPKISVR